jgi:glycosyltransferase involved in cell wall biosynthesis
MAAGLIPVVHRSGGPWTDIVEFGKYGFGFRTEEEAVSHVENLLELKEIELENLRSIVIARSQYFNYEKFRNAIDKLFDKLKATRIDTS